MAKQHKLTDDEKLVIEKLLMFKQHAVQNTWETFLSESSEVAAARLLVDISQMTDLRTTNKVKEAWRVARTENRPQEVYNTCESLIKQIEYNGL